MMVGNDRYRGIAPVSLRNDGDGRNRRSHDGMRRDPRRSEGARAGHGMSGQEGDLAVIEVFLILLLGIMLSTLCMQLM